MAYRRLVLLGAPGVGKGTQARLLTEALNIVHVSTGVILREAKAAGTLRGKDVENSLVGGGLMSDEMMISLVKQRLSMPDCAPGFILDGFPRTLPQAQALDAHQIEIDAVVHLKVPEAHLMQRLIGRQTCTQCGRVFHGDLVPSQDGERCDDCGTLLVNRQDDNEQAVAHRLAVYEEKTKPVVAYYRERGLLKTIDGEALPEVVFASILNQLGVDRATAGIQGV